MIRTNCKIIFTTRLVRNLLTIPSPAGLREVQFQEIRFINKVGTITGKTMVGFNPP